MSNGSALSHYQSNLRYHHTKRYSQSSEYSPDSHAIQRDFKAQSGRILRQSKAKTPISTKPLIRDSIVTNKGRGTQKRPNIAHLNIDDILEARAKQENPGMQS